MCEKETFYLSISKSSLLTQVNMSAGDVSYQEVVVTEVVAVVVKVVKQGLQLNRAADR